MHYKWNHNYDVVIKMVELNVHILTHMQYPLQVHNLTKNKWFVLIAKDSGEKQRWVDAIRREKAKRKSKRILCIAHYTMYKHKMLSQDRV